MGKLLNIYLKISKTDAIKTAISIYKRYIKINPDYKEEYLDFLVSKSLWG